MARLAPSCDRPKPHCHQNNCGEAGSSVDQHGLEISAVMVSFHRAGESSQDAEVVASRRHAVRRLVIRLAFP